MLVVHAWSYGIHCVRVLHVLRSERERAYGVISRIPDIQRSLCVFRAVLAAEVVSHHCPGSVYPDLCNVLHRLHNTSTPHFVNVMNLYVSVMKDRHAVMKMVHHYMNCTNFVMKHVNGDMKFNILDMNVVHGVMK